MNVLIDAAEQGSQWLLAAIRFGPKFDVRNSDDFESLIIYCIYEHKVKMDIIYWLELIKFNGKYFDKYHHRAWTKLNKIHFFSTEFQSTKTFALRNCWCIFEISALMNEMIIGWNWRNPVWFERCKNHANSHIFHAFDQNHDIFNIWKISAISIWNGNFFYSQYSLSHWDWLSTN